MIDKYSELTLLAACAVIWAGTLGYLAHTIAKHNPLASAYVLTDDELRTMAVFGALAECEADRLSLGHTADDYSCARVPE